MKSDNYWYTSTTFEFLTDECEAETCFVTVQNALDSVSVISAEASFYDVPGAIPTCWYYDRNMGDWKKIPTTSGPATGTDAHPVTECIWDSSTLTLTWTKVLDEPATYVDFGWLMAVGNNDYSNGPIRFTWVKAVDVID